MHQQDSVDLSQGQRILVLWLRFSRHRVLARCSINNCQYRTMNIDQRYVSFAYPCLRRLGSYDDNSGARGPAMHVSQGTASSLAQPTVASDFVRDMRAAWTNRDGLLRAGTNGFRSVRGRNMSSRTINMCAGWWPSGRRNLLT